MSACLAPLKLEIIADQSVMMKRKRECVPIDESVFDFKYDKKITALGEARSTKTSSSGGTFAGTVLCVGCCYSVAEYLLI